MARDVPGSVVNSLRVLGLIVATSGVITLLIWLMRDDVILGWAEGNERAQVILAEGGIEQLRDDSIVPGFVALSVVAFVGFALLAMVLAAATRGPATSSPRPRASASWSARSASTTTCRRSSSCSRRSSSSRDWCSRSSSGSARPRPTSARSEPSSPHLPDSS